MHDARLHGHAWETLNYKNLSDRAQVLADIECAAARMVELLAVDMQRSMYHQDDTAPTP